MEPGLLPEFVRLAEGRTQPFEPERITRTLFAAAERIGKNDAFLARELTESVLHFLCEDVDARFVTPEQIAELTEKVVRELGHPALARSYAERSAPLGRLKPAPLEVAWPDWLNPGASSLATRQRAADDLLSEFSISRAFPPELVSAHREGLIQLHGLASPLELSGITSRLDPKRVFECLREVRDLAGSYVACDGPEFDLAMLPGEPTDLARDFMRDVRLAAEFVGLNVILNLHIATPPPRLGQATGPLFAEDSDELRERRLTIARELAQADLGSHVRIWWHSPEKPDRDSLDWIADRARGPIQLGPGLDRQVPATLLQVGVNLVRLVELMGGAPVDSNLFFSKLASLTRFAKTAGHAKQDFLRKHGRPAIREAFLLDRARLVLIPLGLEEVAVLSERPPAEFVREIPRTMKAAAEEDRHRVLMVRIEMSERGL